MYKWRWRCQPFCTPPMTILQKHSHNIFHFMKRHRSIPEKIRSKRTFTTRPKKQNFNRKAFNTCTGGEKYILKKNNKKINQSYLSTAVCFGLDWHVHIQAKDCRESYKIIKETEGRCKTTAINSRLITFWSPLCYSSCIHDDELRERIVVDRKRTLWLLLIESSRSAAVLQGHG